MEPLTPEVQLRLVDLIERWGLWAAVLILVLLIYKKEIGLLITSLRRQDSADHLLGQMVSSFDANLKLFERATDDTAAIKTATESLLTVARDTLREVQELKTETIRGNKR